MNSSEVMPSTAAAGRSTEVRDVSGFRLFSAGDAGAAHVLSHQMLDEGRMEEGHHFLGAWLGQHERPEDDRNGDSDWVHLQWHMAVFEIATGRVREACERFRQEILPAVPAGKALTDAPSLLWRLSLAAAAEPLNVDWKEVHEAARARVARTEDAGDSTDDPYVELHHLLALAGAGDLELLTRWLDDRLETGGGEVRSILLRLGWALRTFATQDYEVAASLLSGTVGPVSQLGGSRAQNELFAELAQEAARRGRAAVAA